MSALVFGFSLGGFAVSAFEGVSRVSDLIPEFQGVRPNCKLFRDDRTIRLFV